MYENQISAKAQCAQGAVLGLAGNTTTEKQTMKQQHSLMKFDPATGDEKPYPSHADQWREWHGKTTAWLFNPWTGTRRLAGDVGDDTFGQLILPPGEPIYAAQQARQGAISGAACGVILAAPLETVEARYKDLLNRLGVQGHDGAVAEIGKLRRTANLAG